MDHLSPVEHSDVVTLGTNFFVLDLNSVKAAETLAVLVHSV